MTPTPPHRTKFVGTGDVPSVSIITIFLNAANFIEEAVESVRAQSFTDWELILVDDGSTDSGTDIAKRYADRFPNIRYIDHPGHINRGMSTSRNLGLLIARGAFIAFIDADDIWLPEKLAQQIAIMDANPSVALVAGAMRSFANYIKKNAANPLVFADHVECLQEFQTGHVQNCVIFPPDALKQLAPLGPFFAPGMSDMLVRRSTIDKVGQFEDQFPGFGEDAVFVTKLVSHVPVYFDSRTWTYYRQHPESCIAQMLANDRRSIELRHLLLWIDCYIRSQANPRQDILRALAWRLIPIRYPYVDQLRRIGKLVVPAAFRSWLRTRLRQIEIAIFHP